MKTDIILAGVGGQGIISLGAILGKAAMAEGLKIKQSETHGMSQRGGAVVAHVRLADKVVHADLIHHGQADVILAIEPLEALRQLPYLHKSGLVISNTEPVKTINNYPEEAQLSQAFSRLPRVLLIDALRLLPTPKHKKAANLVMLGALSAFISISHEQLKTSISRVFSHLDAGIIEVNLEAFQLGYEHALSTLQ